MTELNREWKAPFGAPPGPPSAAAVGHKNVDWKLTPLPDGTLAQGEVNLAILMDIRSQLASINSKLAFFFALTLIGLIFGLAVFAGGR